jgi:hypothetical protein
MGHEKIKNKKLSATGAVTVTRPAGPTPHPSSLRLPANGDVDAPRLGPFGLGVLGNRAGTHWLAAMRAAHRSISQGAQHYFNKEQMPNELCSN